MQEILYNGKIVTNNEKKELADAMMINDGSIFFAGEKEEVLNLKTDDTSVSNLNGGYVYPALFDVKTDIFNKIDKKLKNAKKIKNFQVSADIDENYENFIHFEEYKKEYLKIEKEYIKKGIATIVETNIDKLQFAFWKKMSEEKMLTLDVVCYVDMLDSKQVMDDNCVTYRKYKNHLRLGGYYLKIDGRVQDLKAWVKRPYAGTKSYCGSGELYGEQLYYLIKMALEERKQIYFEINGDKAISEILTVLKEVEEKNNIHEFYRPIFYGAAVVDKRVYNDLKHFDITLIFEEFGKQETKLIKKFLGLTRRKLFHNYKSLLKNELRFTYLNKQIAMQDFKSYLDVLLNKKRRFDEKTFKNNKYNALYVDFLFKVMYLNQAYICFDQDTKGSIETQKQASFIALEHDFFDAYPNPNKIKMVYIKGEKQKY